MWVLPPLMGQKVILNPSGPNYTHYEARQARGTAGYIADTSSSVSRDWHLLDETNILRKHVGVTWENGHTNGYSLKDILPLDVFKDSGYIKFDDGDQVDIGFEELEEYIDDKIIRQGSRIVKETRYDEAYRKKIYIELRNHINVVIEKGQITPHQSNIIGALSDMGYSFGNPEDKPYTPSFSVGDAGQVRQSVLDQFVEPVEMTPELRHAMDTLAERHGVVEYRTDGRYHVANDDEEPQF